MNDNPFRKASVIDVYMTHCPLRHLHIGIKSQRGKRVSASIRPGTRRRERSVRHSLPCLATAEQCNGFFRSGLFRRFMRGLLRINIFRLHIAFLYRMTRQSMRVIQNDASSFSLHLLRWFRSNLRNKECNL